MSPLMSHSFNPRFISLISTYSSKLYLEIRYCCGEVNTLVFAKNVLSSRSSRGNSRNNPLSFDNLSNDSLM